MCELASIPRWLLLNACPSKHSDVGPTSSRRHVDRQRPTVIFYLKFPIGTIPICQSYVNVTRECYVCNACFTYRSTAYKTFRTGRRITPPPLFFRRVSNVLMVYYIRPSSSNCLSMHYMTAPLDARAMQARFIKQTCAVRRDTENIMIDRSVTVQRDTHTHTM